MITRETWRERGARRHGPGRSPAADARWLRAGGAAVPRLGQDRTLGTYRRACARVLSVSARAEGAAAGYRALHFVKREPGVVLMLTMYAKNETTTWPLVGRDPNAAE